MNIEEYSEFYHNFFKLAYADLVALIADKPQQIIFEIENSFSHLMVYYDKEISEDVRNSNLIKAYNHLVRATMDCYKIAWTELSNFLDDIIEDNSSRTFSFNESDIQVMNIWKNFKNKAHKARTEEMKNIGSNPIETIYLYKEAVDEGKILLEKFDFNKFKKVRKFNIINLIKSQLIGFILGILSGIIATWIMA